VDVRDDSNEPSPSLGRKDGLPQAWMEAAGEPIETQPRSTLPTTLSLQARANAAHSAMAERARHRQHEKALSKSARPASVEEW